MPRIAETNESISNCLDTFKCIAFAFRKIQINSGYMLDLEFIVNLINEIFQPISFRHANLFLFSVNPKSKTNIFTSNVLDFTNKTMHMQSSILVHGCNGQTKLYAIRREHCIVLYSTHSIVTHNTQARHFSFEQMENLVGVCNDVDTMG